MRPQDIVDNLIEEPFGPPIPDKWQQALGTTRHLRGLKRKQDVTLRDLEKALQIERQLQKHGLTKQEVSHYIRADQKEPSKYNRLMSRFRPSVPPDALVGLETNDGREIMFDFPVIAT